MQYYCYMEDDSVFARASGAGDATAFGVLYDRYAERIYRFIYYKTFSKEVAEDLVSEVFLKAFEKINSYTEEKGTFSAWIYRIARNAVIDHYRTRKSSIPVEDIFDLGTDDRTPEALDAVASLKKVEEYLATLTPRQREIITLRVWEERSYREIAEIVGGTEDSVKMMFSRSIRELRTACGPLALTLLFTLLQTSTLPFEEIS